jgi:hypothetical protein
MLDHPRENTDKRTPKSACKACGFSLQRVQIAMLFIRKCSKSSIRIRKDNQRRWPSPRERVYIPSSLLQMSPQILLLRFLNSPDKFFRPPHRRNFRQQRRDRCRRGIESRFTCGGTYKIKTTAGIKVKHGMIVPGKRRNTLQPKPCLFYFSAIWMTMVESSHP